MTNIMKYLLCLEVLIITCYGTVIETDDAIIIEADPESISTLIRNKRNTALDPQKPRSASNIPTWQDTLGEGNTCITSKGRLGSCTSFRTCYPYFKIPDLSVWESWVLGNYDSCSYFNEEARQSYGVCCTNPISPPVTNEEPTEANNNPTEAPSHSNKVPRPSNPTYQYWDFSSNQWPPSQPTAATHPPIHTAPTHPPSTQYTTTPQQTTWPTNQPIGSTTPPYNYYPTTQRPTTASPGGACGIKNTNPDQERIVGGQNASPLEWPWIAVLFHGTRQFCGGSLIDEIHIISAAHCVAHMSSWDVARLSIRLGDHNINSDYEVQHIERKVKRVVRHRGFDSRTLYHDISVLTMDRPVTYTTAIHPICLPHNTAKDYSGKMATVIGWGSLRENGPQPALLQEVAIPIWNNPQCSQKYGTAAPAGIDAGMLCAGQTAKDSCSGDSGGPLMVNENNIWYQVGVVSWGIGCGKGQYPGVYARITHYLPWISKNIVDK